MHKHTQPPTTDSMDSEKKRHREHDLWTIMLFTGASLGIVTAAAVIRRRPRCRLCRRTVEGELESIRLKIVCRDCTTDCFTGDEESDPYPYSIPAVDALQKSGCLEKDLARLRHGITDATGSSLCKSEKRYIKSEVWYLRNLRRKEAIEKALGFELKSLHPLIRLCLLGDYLTRLMDSQTTREDILRYKDVAHRASEIVEQCPGAIPNVVLEFCLDHPHAGPCTFEDLRQKIRRVFALEGRRILHGLTVAEREGLRDGPLEDVYDAFRAESSDDILRGYLSQWFDPVSIDAIMKDDRWRQFNWCTGSEDRLAIRLKAFWIEKRRRRTELEDALRKQNLTLPDNCDYCKDYMDGVGTLELSSVVACVELTQHLVKLELCPPRYEWQLGFTVMISILEEKKEPKEAIKRALDAVRQAIEEIEAELSDEDFDPFDI